MNLRFMFACTFLATPVAAQAVDVTLYGHANKAVVVYDDGRDTETAFADNGRYSTRFGFTGEQKLENGLTASVLIEQELASNGTDATLAQTTGGDTNNNGIIDASETATQSTPVGGTGANLTERHSRVGLSGNWGSVFLGLTSTATDGITEIDLAGTDDVLASNIEDIGGGLQFRLSNGTRSGVTVAQMVDTFDGLRGADADRTENIQYHSPIFHGFQAKVAAAQGGDMDGAVLYNGKFDAFQVAAGVGYVAFNRNNTTASNEIESQVSGSVSVKHDSGLGLTAAYGAQEIDRAAAGIDDPEFYYVKAGYSWDAFEVAVDFSESSDVTQVAADTETTSYGVGGQYNMGNGVSLGALYRQFDMDRTGVRTDEINLYALNMRVKF